jgi:hypothetical protein
MYTATGSAKDNQDKDDKQREERNGDANSNLSAL